jgi:hypothetical protein
MGGKPQGIVDII